MEATRCSRTEGDATTAAMRRGAVVPRSEPAWWLVMGFPGGPPRSLALVEASFRRLAAQAHPDRGGSAADMQRLLRARALARRQLGRRPG